MEKIKLSKPIKVKRVSHHIAFSNRDDVITVNNLSSANKGLVNKLESGYVSEIVYPGPVDDIRTCRTRSDNAKIFSSCDSGRGYIIWDNGRVDIVSPYEVWDDWKEGPNALSSSVNKCKVWASGFFKGKTLYIDTIYIHSLSTKLVDSSIM